MKPSRRDGFSLMEVLLAMTILLGSVIVLARLADIGRQHVHSADFLTNAQLLCQNKMNEMLAGIAPLEPAHEESFPDHPGWVYSVQIEPREPSGLLAVRVTVSEDMGRDRLQAGRPPREFSLVRWIRDPNREPASNGFLVTERTLGNAYHTTRRSEAEPR